MPVGNVKKFNIKGMDCASCVAKIETAVKRIDGTSDIKVGLQTETLSVTVADSDVELRVAKVVRDLGYASSVAAVGNSTKDSHLTQADGHDHSDHAEQIEGAWWESSKGIFVIATGVMMGLAYLEGRILPYGSQLVFLAAAAVGTFAILADTRATVLVTANAVRLLKKI